MLFITGKPFIVVTIAVPASLVLGIEYIAFIWGAAANEKLREKNYSNQHIHISDPYAESDYWHIIREHRRVIEEMPPQRQLIYQMVRENNLSYKEISEKLGISTKTIGRHINEAMRTLREEFRPTRIFTDEG